MSLVTERLTFFSLRKIMQPVNNCGGGLPPPPPNAPPPQTWEITPHGLLLVAWYKVRQWYMFFLIWSTRSLLSFTYSHSRTLWFLPLFSGFSHTFYPQLWEGQDHGAVIMPQSDSHIQQLNTGNEGKTIGRAMGVFTGGSNRKIVQNFPFLDNTEPTQGDNCVATIVANTWLQCAASIGPSSVRQSMQTIL